VIYPAFQTLDALFEHLSDQGTALYGGEAVSQLEHALQSAQAAEKSGADAALITAALLHDLGHILCQQADDDLARGINDHHEALAVQALSLRFCCPLPCMWPPNAICAARVRATLPPCLLPRTSHCNCKAARCRLPRLCALPGTRRHKRHWPYAPAMMPPRFPACPRRHCPTTRPLRPKS